MANETASTPADLALVGGRVVTFDPRTRGAEGVAVRGGRIAAVGTYRQVRDLIGPATQVVDVHGGTVLPGFQDAHVHPDHGGLARMRCDLHEVRGIDNYERAVARYATSHRDVPWILGAGWSLDDFPGGNPSRRTLDAVVPDRPVFLPNRDGHDAWVNTRALQLAGLDAGSPDPPDGRIEREPDGFPAGALHEGAMDLVERHVPPPTPSEVEEALLEAQRYLHSLGVVGWQDAWATEDSLHAYRTLAEDGRLTARVVAAVWWDRHGGVEQVDALLRLRREFTAGRLRTTAVKIMQDGITENFTAAMIDDYLDAEGEPSGRRGLSFVEPSTLAGYVTRLDQEGFQVHVHAIGDRAVREALDAFESAAAANGRRDARHHIAHLQVIHPDDVARFAALGVVPNLQPYWACLDGQMRNLVVPFLGPERTAWQYPFAALHSSGATLAMGSDWPVSTPDPLKEIQVAMTRLPYDEPSQPPFLPGQRLDLDTCLRAFTLGSAFVNHDDDETGSIEPGKLASLAVVGADLFALPAGEVGEAPVVLTLAEGQPVHVGEGISW
jgi:predicted amidohydrolase YtcJ